jgi:hypothetical protein
MTISQIFESSAVQKTIWTKKGNSLSKRTIHPLSMVVKKTNIERQKESS